MNKQQVKELALANGFKLKQQPSDEMDLNTYVYDFAEALLAKANERVDGLESAIATAIDAFNKYEMDVDTYPTIEHVKMKNGLHECLNKFAIEKKIEGVNDFCATLQGYEDVQPIGANYVTSVASHRDSFIEQLRKEQE